MVVPAGLLLEQPRRIELGPGLPQDDVEHRHGYNSYTKHTGATWLRRGRSIRMSCKPRSPVGLVNPPAKRKCEERSRTRRLGNLAGDAAPGLPVARRRRQRTGSARRES